MYTLLVLALASSILATDWPQFRGPAGGSTAAKAAIPDEWGPDKNVAWSTPLPGSGWAQPVIIGQRVFIATAVSDPPLLPKNMMQGVMDPRSRPDPKVKGPKPGPDVKLEWQLLALDLATGKLLWTKTVASGKPKYAIHPSNTYATETPCADGDRVYVFFAAAGLVAAYDHAGTEVWRKDVGVFPGSADLGLGASPALHSGKLFIPLLNEEKATTLCLDPATGKELWKLDREKPGTSWATPYIWQNTQRTELVVCGKGMVTSHDLETGKELWRLTNVDSSFSSSPTATEDVMVFGNGGPGSVSPLIGVRAGAQGDISLKDKETANQGVVFYKRGSAPGMSSPVAVGDLVFVPGSGTLACYEAKTGKQLFKERLKDGRTFAATAVVVDGKIYLTEESGKTLVLKAGPKLEVLHTNALDDTFWSSPAVAGDRLLLRGVKALYCIKK